MKPRCPQCNREMVSVAGPLNSKTFSMGTIRVDGIERLECACGEKQFTAESLRKLQSILDEKERDLIGRLPVKHFLAAPLAYALLGVSRQAFSKRMQTAKRKFPYSITQIVGGKDSRLFFRPSLEKFKETGDGRLDLRPYLDAPATTVYSNQDARPANSIGFTVIMVDAEFIRGPTLPDYYSYPGTVAHSRASVARERF